MNRSGPIALIGGSEHRDVTVPIDRRLMDLTGRGRVRVTVVPVASSARKLPLTAALARNYWTSLGASVRFAVPDGGTSEAALDALTDADIVVLTGGVPERLVGALGASPVWDRILDLWRSGTALSGSSAGSMAMFTWRFHLYPPHPARLVPGLGPLDGFVAFPHFDRYVAGRPRRVALLDHVFAADPRRGILGLDEGTALVGWDGRYSVRGRGSVTALVDGAWTTYPAGASVGLELHPILGADAVLAEEYRAGAERRTVHVA